jgi:hypothetical protein
MPWKEKSVKNRQEWSITRFDEPEILTEKVLKMKRQTMIFISMVLFLSLTCMTPVTSLAQNEADTETIDAEADDTAAAEAVGDNELNTNESAEKAREIMQYIDDLWRGGSSRATIQMIIKTDRWERNLTMTGWSLGTDYSLVRILSPAREAGTATLKHENDIYNYLPKTDRTIKITSGMMMGSWMGSHFTNDDLVKESRMAQDYNQRIVFEGERNAVDIYEIQLIPKPDAAVVWGSILFSVRKEDRMPLKARYFDDADTLVRTMTFDDHKTMGDRLLPAVMRLTPEDHPGEFTEMIYQDIEFDLDLEPSFFSLRNLRSL